MILAELVHTCEQTSFWIDDTHKTNKGRSLTTPAL